MWGPHQEISGQLQQSPTLTSLTDMEVMKALNLDPCRFNEGNDTAQTLPDARVLGFASEYFL